MELDARLVEFNLYIDDDELIDVNIIGLLEDEIVIDIGALIVAVENKVDVNLVLVVDLVEL